jgi:hypothetical protein
MKRLPTGTVRKLLRMGTKIEDEEKGGVSPFFWHDTSVLTE